MPRLSLSTPDRRRALPGKVGRVLAACHERECRAADRDESTPFARVAAVRPLTAFVCLLGLFIASPSRAGEPPTYERDIKPLLAKRCVVCHNGKKLDKPEISGGLALDSLEAILQGTKDHKVVQPSHSVDSEIYRRLVDTDDETRMPLMEDALPVAQREVVRRWIDAGAPRGEPLTDAGSTNPATLARRRIVRSLDLVLNLETPVPANTPGVAQAGPLALALKVGPLPAVSAVAFRDDAGLLAVGTLGEVVLWDLLTGRPAVILSNLPGAVHALAFNRDGRRIAVGSGLPGRSGAVRIYSVPDGTLLHDFTGHEDVVYGVAWRQDGAQLASAAFDQTVRLWNLTDGQPAGVFKGHSDFVYDVAYAPDGRTVLSASKDRSIKRFDGATVKSLRTYSDHDDDVLAVAVKPGTADFVSAGNEPALRWWSIDKDAPSKRVGGHGGPVYQLAFSGNGKRLISASGDKSVRTWDGESGNFQRLLPGPTEWQYAVALSFDGTLAAAGGWDGIVRLWDAESGKIRAVLLQPPSTKPRDADWLALASNGYLAVSPGLKDLVRWRVGTGEVSPQPLSALLMNPDRLAQSFQGKTVPPPFTVPK